jgi:UDP-N-acetyl-D-glucosamine dehydrogenase
MLRDRESADAEALPSAATSVGASVGVMGLGYVGLPLAMASVAAGFDVTGFDINPGRVAAINAGSQVISYIPAERMQATLATGRFRAAAEFSRLGACDIVVICVPTPLTRHRIPDLSFVEATARDIAAHLRRGQLVVLESTTWPGTTDEVVRPILEAAGLKSGTDFFLAYSPEREDPGSERFALSSIPKVVGADDAAALERATAYYRRITQSVVTVSSTRTAEATKLTENIFRSVNIALVNELKTVYAEMGIDVWEVIEAAASKPFGYMPFYPGPGLGGHCIPIDPFYLTWKAREFEVESRFVELAGQINTRMPHLVIDRLARALGEAGGRSLHGAGILVIGVAYKKNVDDIRESPALKLMDLILERGGRCDYCDPFVAAIPPTREYRHLAGQAAVTLSAEGVAGYDAVLIATDHDVIDYELLARHARLIVDTRNAFARRGLGGAHVVKA